MAIVVRTQTFLLLTFLISCTLPPSFSVEEHVDGRRRGFSLKLIHRDSPHSPLYNPSATAKDLLESTERHSFERLRYFQSTAPGGGGPQLEYNHGQAPVSPGGSGIYLTEVGIGYHAVKSSVFIDTGSSMSWIQCLPCTECFRQSAPIFDPSKSFTYYPIPCFATDCKVSPGTKCVSDVCKFEVKYFDGRYSNGDFAADNFVITFPETKAGVILDNVLFGCAHNSSDKFPNEYQGVVALDASMTSFAVQATGRLSQDRTFSYCLVPLTEKQHGSQMSFGDIAVRAGNPTPMAVPLRATTLYYLNLEDISVGSERLGILPGTFRMSRTGSGGLIIDCGSTYTYLVQDGYDAVVEKLKKVVPLTLYLDHPILCFKGSSADFPKVPDITFHFENLDVVTKPLNNFYEVKGFFWQSLICLGMRSSNYGMSIFGVMQQQNMNVGYDLDARKVYISPAECRTF